MPRKRATRHVFRTPVVLASLCGILMAAFGRHMHRRIPEEVAASEIRGMGGKVVSSPVFDHRLLLGNADQARAWHNWLVSGFCTVTEVRLVGTQITDDKLSVLAGLVNLRRLSLGKTSINGEGLAYLGGLKRLVHLDLRETSIGDAALRHVSGLPDLESLNLSCTQVTDAGLQQLATLKELKRLVLVGTKVTTEGTGRIQTLLPRVRVYVNNDG